MASSGTATDTTVFEEGVEIQQRYAETEFDLPAVVFTVTSEHSEPVAIRFTVSDIEASTVGFHPEFASDAWAVADGRLVFDSSIEPDDELTTLYAIDTDDRSVFERAMDSVRIERVTPLSETPQPGDGTDETTPSEGEADGTTRSDGETDEAAQSDTSLEMTAGPQEIDEPDSEFDAIDRYYEQAQRRVTNGSADSGPSTETLVEELCERIEAEGLDPEHRERLRAAGLETGEQGSDGIRLANLQARVSDIEAFTASVERFAAQHGPPAAAFEELEERIAAVEELENRLGAVEEGVDAVEEEVEGFSEQIGHVDERVDTLGETFESTTEELESDIAGIESEIAEVSDTLSTVQTDVSAVETDVETAREDASDASERASAVESDLESVEDQLATLDDRLANIEGDWEELGEDVTALQEWRNNLASTFEAFEE